MTSANNHSIDSMLEHTIQRPRSAKPPQTPGRRIIASRFREWAGSQVAAYRVGLVLGYLAMMYFGTSALIAGIPAFEFTTPEGWTPIWASVVIGGGLIGGIGAIRAGIEPADKEVRMFNRIELLGASLLFLTLGAYAAVLLVLGYGYGDIGRSAAGAGFVALGVHPTVRMLWLIFRPRFLASRAYNPPVVMIPAGHALFTIDESGNPLVAVATAPKVSEAP